MESDYDANADAYKSGSERFDFNDRIYGANAVRVALKQHQHNKGCYSEAKFSVEQPHIEHFRSKSSVRSDESSERRYPGYYWLAYTWSNLFLSKAGINSLKSDIFPLENEESRAQSHHDDIASENPLLIDPSHEDPRDHIRFDGAEPYGITDRGRCTVKLLLRHPEIAEDRLRYLSDLRLLRDAVTALRSKRTPESEDKAGEIAAELENRKSPKAEYSSMAIDFLSTD